MRRYRHLLILFALPLTLPYFTSPVCSFAQTPPFTQCPPVGADTSCETLIVVTDAGTTIVTDPSQGPYDQIEDTLIGVQNDSSQILFSLPLNGTSEPFDFDGDGICGTDPNTGVPYVPAPTGCPFGATGYEGLGVTFANISPDFSFGLAQFAGGIPPGGSGYFSLESNILTALAAPLVDPVPSLLNPGVGSGITQDTDALASQGRIVSGVAADGVSRAVLRIPASIVGEQFDVSLLNDQGQPTSSPAEDGGLGQISDSSFNQNGLTVPPAVNTPSGPMAFAVYEAPVDFVRPSNSTNPNAQSDPNGQSRSVTIQALSELTSQTVSTTVTILRPPVVLIHGLWGRSTDWDSFKPLISDSEERFSVQRVDYSGKIGSLITLFTPLPPPIVINPAATVLLVNLNARSNSLGFSFNAPKVLSQIGVSIDNFKNSGNPLNLPVAAIQADLIVHSMGGDITRYLPLLGSFLGITNFSQGPVHKVITIDTPHLRSPLAYDLLPDASGNDPKACVRYLFMTQGKFAFESVLLGLSSVVSGAVNDLSENPNSGTLSTALQALHQSSTPRLPTALIAAAIGPAQLNPIDSAKTAGQIRTVCGAINIFANDPLANDLTSSGWPTVFGGAGNAIVSLSSQLDGLPGTAFGAAVHSQGVETLGFGGPDVLDQASLVPQQAINLLNIPVTDHSTFVALP